MTFSALAVILIYAVAVPLPGPSFVAISRATIANGRMAGACAALGVTLAAAIYAVSALLGISALLTAFPWVITMIQICGGIYLITLGAALLRSHFRAADNTLESLQHSRSNITVASLKDALLKGFAVTIGNPKMAVFFFGLFAPVAGQAIPTEIRIMVLLGIIAVDLIYHQLLAQFMAFMAHSNAARHLTYWLDAVAGALMAIFGGGLLFSAIGIT